MPDHLLSELRDLRTQNFHINSDTRESLLKNVHAASRRRKASIGAAFAAPLVAAGVALSLPAVTAPAIAADVRPMPVYVEIDSTGAIDVGRMNALFNQNTPRVEVAQRFVSEVLGLNVYETSDIQDGLDGFAAVSVRTSSAQLRIEVSGDPTTRPAPSSNPFGPWISAVVDEDLMHFSDDFAMPTAFLLSSNQDLDTLQRTQQIQIELPKMPCESGALVELKTWNSNGPQTVGRAQQPANHDNVFQYRLPVAFKISHSAWAFAVVTCRDSGVSRFMFAAPVALLSPNTVSQSIQVTLSGAKLKMRPEDVFSGKSTPWMFQRRFTTKDAVWFSGPDTKSPLSFSVRSGLGQLSPKSYCAFLGKELQTVETFTIADSRFRCGVLSDHIAVAVFEVRPGLTLEVQNVWVENPDWKLSHNDWAALANQFTITEETGQTATY